MDIWMTLSKAASLWPRREAVADGSVHLCYQDLLRVVVACASALSRKGVDQGKVAAIIAPNVYEFMVAYYACAGLGAILAPINFRLASREIEFILQDSSTVVLFCHTDFAEHAASVVESCPRLRLVIWIGPGKAPAVPIPSRHFDELIGAAADAPFSRSQLHSDCVAHLYYTSGTTGHPKGVMLTHGNVMFHALAAIADLRLSDKDTWAHVAPMFHLADAWATFAITWVGGKHVFVPYFRSPDVLSAFEREKVTITNLIPTMLNAMVNDPGVCDCDLSSLRLLMSGGAPIAPETVRRIVTTFGCDYIQTYGMTETSPYLTVSVLKEHLRQLPPERQLEFKSRTGRPFTGVELKVVRADGSEVDWNDSEVGEIIVRGPTVTPGYWNQPAATADAIRDGWLYTGDLAVVDPEGYVNIVDRKKDLIITGGENVYSTEVEHVLYEHPGVLECAVIGVPDQKWGEAVKAVIVARPGSTPTESELIEFCRGRLARYKCPSTVDFVDELPKTGSGKIQKKVLRDRYWQGSQRKI